MNIRVDTKDSKAILGLTGRFDFTVHKEFRNVTEKLLETESLKEIELNLQDVDYLDSSALGMLLLLKDHANQKGTSIVISGCQETVKQILEVANFSKLFKISA